MQDRLPDLSLTEVAALLAAKKVSAVEVTEACLSRIAESQPRLNCFIEVAADEALARARELDSEIVARGPRGPLHGVPVAHKDVFFREGKICSAGSKILASWIPPYTATVMRRLDEAGAVTVGRLNTSEFAGDSTGYNKHYGICRNAWNPDYIAGGSSSGSGSAVGGRLVYASLGTCTGGSVRIPAAANGVLGLTPTYGRVSRRGVIARAWSLDHVGCLTRSALDAARVFGVVAGYDPEDGTSLAEPVPDVEAAALRDIRGMRIGIPAHHFYDEVTNDVHRALDHSLDVLESLGAVIVPVSAPDPALFHRLSDLIQKCESSTIHGRWLRERPGDYSDYVRNRFEAGLHIPATWYIEALTARGPALEQFMRAVMDKVDVLHCPAIPIPVPTLAEMNPEAATLDVLERMIRLMALTRIFNFLGVPSLAVPCGFSASGLPVAFQVAARPLGEASLFAVAHAFQTATDWHRRPPPRFAPPE